MEIRAILNDHPAVTKVILGVVIVTAVTAIFFENRNQGGIEAPPKKAYFTIDDGATYYADDIGLAPPFTKDGKTVLKAYVFQGASGKPWIQYLGRYSPSAKANIEKLVQQKADPQQLGNALSDGLQVKAPLTGDTGWVGAMSAEGGSICAVHRPPGVLDPLEPASP